MRSLLLLLLCAAVGCGSSPRPSESHHQPEPETDPVVDTVPPELQLAAPVEGASVDEPRVEVRGTASDAGGIASIRYRIRGTETGIAIVRGAEVSFSFSVELLDGSNELEVEARDEAGNVTTVKRQVRCNNPPDVAPQIESFTSDKRYAARGETVALSWEVSGTKPIRLSLFADAPQATDVTGTTGAEVPIERWDYQRFRLYASNDAGTASAEILIPVGEALDVWPTSAVIVPGSRQRLVVRNAPAVDWTATGGTLELAAADAPWFAADEPGVYELTATTRETPPRMAHVTIEVAAIPSPVSGYRGVGGQGQARIGGKPVVAPDGTLFVPTSSTAGVMRHRPGEGWRWIAGGLDEGAELLALAPTGDLWATLRGSLYRLPAGGDAFEKVDTLTTELGWSFWRLAIAPDGVLHLVLADNSWSAQLWTWSPGEGFQQHDRPGISRIDVLLFAADGTCWIAGEDRIFRRDPGANAWTELPRAPEGDRPIRALLIDGAGRLALARNGVHVLVDGAWIDRSEWLPDCAENVHCEVTELALRSDGALLALEATGVYGAVGDAPFEPVGEPPPALLSGGLAGIATDAAGNLYVGGQAGTFVLPDGARNWVPVEDRGLRAGAEVNDLLLEPDGSLLLASGRGYEEEGHFALYRRPAASESWEGISLGIEATFGRHFAPTIRNLRRDGAGNLYFNSWDPLVYRRDGVDGSLLQLPNDPGFGNGLDALAVSSAGVVFVQPKWGSATLLTWEAPADRWVRMENVPCAGRLDWTEDGSVWWSCSGRVHRWSDDERSWEVMFPDGPLLPGTVNDLASSPNGLLLATTGGVFRLGNEGWERFGYGGPSLAAVRISSHGGRTFVDDGRIGLWELDAATGAWLPLPTRPAGSTAFQATEEGLLFGSPYGNGLVCTTDSP